MRRRAAEARVPSLVHDVLRSSGKPIDRATRSTMEQRFGRDFSGVRVHDDADAARSAAAVQADAYTAGRDIVFGKDRYSPQNRAGARLLAHVVQDDARPGKAPLEVGAADTREERAADRAADAEAHGARAPAASGDGSKLRRQAAADPSAAAREQIITLGESDDPANRQHALDLIISTYYARPPNFDGIFYDPNLRSTSPQDAETGPSRGQDSFGGRQRTTIGPHFFHDIRRRFVQRVRTIGHELQHVGQRSPPGGRTFLSTLGGVGLGAGIGAALGGIGLGIAAAAGASLTGGLIGGVLGGAAALGGAIGGIADPFGGGEEPVRNMHTREFLAIHWTLTAQVRNLGELPRGQVLTSLNQPGSGALAEYAQMPPEDQNRYRPQYEQLLRIKQRLESQGHAAPAAQGAGP
jgi:hypothetical protein